MLIIPSVVWIGLQFYTASADNYLLDTTLMDRKYIRKGTTDTVKAETSYVKVLDTEAGCGLLLS